MITDDDNGGVMIDLRVQPGAGRSAIVGRHGDAVKVRIAAPPIDGRANAAILELLAEELGVKQADVELVSGETGRSKRVRVGGINAAFATERLLGDSQAADGRNAGRRR